MLSSPECGQRKPTQSPSQRPQRQDRQPPCTAFWGCTAVTQEKVLSKLDVTCYENQSWCPTGSRGRPVGHASHRERETLSIAYKTSKTSSEREWTQVNIGLSTLLSPVCWMVQATH